MADGVDTWVQGVDAAGHQPAVDRAFGHPDLNQLGT
jgi:hypothetical protein